MTRRTLLGFALVGALGTTTGAAHADTTGYPPCTRTSVPAGDSESAHAKYIAGKQDYDEGNYESAVRRFRDAYALDCTKHELLLYISSAYERKGDKKEALSALETYVARVPNAPELNTYQAKIDNLKKDLAKAPPPAPASATTKPVTPAQPTAEPRGHTPYPWIVVGVGGAAMAAGLAVALTAPSLPSNCSDSTGQCVPRAGESPSDVDNDKSTATRSKNQPPLGWGIFGGGAALVAGGLIWHFLEPTEPKKDSAKTRVTPSIAPGFAGMTVGGAF